jgi:hypothetical protein
LKIILFVIVLIISIILGAVGGFIGGSVYMGYWAVQKITPFISGNDNGSGETFDNL